MAKRAMVIGVFLTGATPDEFQEMHKGIAAAIAVNKVNPYVGKVFALSEADKAHIEVISPAAGGAQGKVILHPW